MPATATFTIQRQIGLYGSCRDINAVIDGEIVGTAHLSVTEHGPRWFVGEAVVETQEQAELMLRRAA